MVVKPTYEELERRVNELEMKSLEYEGFEEALRRQYGICNNLLEGMRKKAAEIEDLYNNAPCGYHSLDKDGYFIKINDTELSWLGYTREEVIGKIKATDIITPVSIEKFKTNYPLFIKTGRISELDFEFIRKDGTVIPVLLTASAVYNEHGDYIMSRTTLFDVTLHKRMEEELRRSKTLLDKTFSSLKEVVLIVDPQTRTILSANPAVTHIFGYGISEVVGRNTGFLHVSSETYEEFGRRLFKALNEKGEYHDSFMMICKDGRIIDTEHSVTEILDETGKRTAVVSVIRDVTERKQAELKYSTIIQGTVDSFAISSLSTGRFLDVNEAYCNLIGYSREELLKMKIDDVEALESSVDIADHVKKIMEAGSDRFETRHRCKDGRIVDIDVSVNYINIEGGLFFSFFRDITERKKAELEYRTIIQGALDGFVMLDSKGCFLDVNDTYSHLIGYSRDELLKMSVSDVEAIEKPEDTARRIRKVMDSGSDSFETRHRHKDGNLIDIEVSANYEDIEGGRFYSFYRDITERKKAESELRRSREQLRILAHDLQLAREEERKRVARDIHDELGQALTVLNIELSCIEEMLDEKQEPVMNKIRQAISLVDGTIDTIQRISSDLRPTLLDDLGITAAIESYAKKFKDRTGIETLTVFHPDKINIDRTLSTELFRVFQEAMTNVSRHAKATQVDISLRRVDHRLVLQIADNGKGINTEQIEDPGSVGLTGMRERVYPWNGKLHITGGQGKGTVVTVVVPIVSEG